MSYSEVSCDDILVRRRRCGKVLAIRNAPSSSETEIFGTGIAFLSDNSDFLMTRRLGMRWQEFDLRNAALRASDNGYLTSTSIRGLGIVVQFSPNLRDSKPDDLIPIKAVNRMICGILAGCAEPGIRDYHVISDNGKVLNVRCLLTDSEVPHEIREDMSADYMAHLLGFWEKNK